MDDLFWIILLVIHVALFLLFYCLGRTVKQRLNNHPALIMARAQRSGVSKADAKSTPAYSLDLHFSVVHYRPDRGTLICSKICSKEL